MGKELSPIQLRRVKSAKRLFHISNDPNKLYDLVVIMGPSLFGSLIGSNTDTIWSKIENPGNFRYDEMVIYANLLEVSLVEFMETVQKQKIYNQKELKHKRPIGRFKFHGSNKK